MFIYHPPLLGQGTLLEVMMATGTGVIGFVLIGAVFLWQRATPDRGGDAASVADKPAR
ncbi:hypothetical protein J2T57_000587 [Natronocella acetinitrilica]|uniref:Uncharacterized protein n=1 Tax=Natronocella acetinitrilica TaxID=414046 RepID=A0AAE3G0K3_9GAMM|nr:hypothetical protein [Natronocella acetinitrilica]MCP1673495.1 hypothetical protein [Natronocella acetinitrilica]